MDTATTEIYTYGHTLSPRRSSDLRITGDRTMQPRAHALRQAIMLALAGTALTLASVANAQQRAFDIPATDAVAALPEYARQAGVQIVAPGGQLRGLRTPAVEEIGRASCRERVWQAV